MNESKRIYENITSTMLDWSDFLESLKNREQKTIWNPEWIMDFLKIFWANARFDERKISLTDVSLREWDQAPLTSFSKYEKMVVYLMLRELWVDTIEVWFPAWDNDFNNIKELLDFFSDDPNPPFISVLWRCVKHDTTRSIEATKWLKRSRIHCFMPTSEAHILDKFCYKVDEDSWEKFQKKSLIEWKQYILDSIKTTVSRLNEIKKEREITWCEFEIEYSPEDATNSKYNFLLEAVRTAIKSWANVINVPDTVWVSKPEVYKSLFYHLIKDTKDLEESGYNFRFSSHIHNDKDFASAWTLAAVEWWVQECETTLVWIWERTWNTKTHMAWMMFWIDWESNWGFSFKNAKKMHLMYIFCNAIRQILSDDTWNREPWIWKNAQADWSWVHTANVAVYGGAKPYSGSFWVLALEKYFSARWWKNFLKELADQVELNLSNTPPDQIRQIIECLSKDAEIQRRVYPANILTKYLKINNMLSDIDFCLDNHKKTVRIEFILNWKKIILNEEFLEWNWYIEAIIRGFKKMLWKNVDVKLLDYNTQEKPSLKTVIEEVLSNVNKLIEQENDDIVDVSNYFKQKTLKILSELTWDQEEWEKSIWITHFTFEMNGKERNTVVYWHDTQKSTIEAICQAFLPELLKISKYI